MGNHKGDLGESYRLDYLENCWAAYYEYEESEQPGRDGVLVVLFLGSLGHITPHGNVFAGNLVGDTHPLFGGHFKWLADIFVN